MNQPIRQASPTAQQTVGPSAEQLAEAWDRQQASQNDAAMRASAIFRRARRFGFWCLNIAFILAVSWGGSWLAHWLGTGPG